MAVLDAEDLRFFDENGYVIVRQAAPQENLNAAIRAIWEFLEMDPYDSETWYCGARRGGGIVHIHQHQALWDNRQFPRIHQAFAEIFGTEKLWVSMDRAGMKPPVHPDHPEHEDKGFIHWDLDTSKLPVPFGVQGVLCLTDTDANMGGFQCIPGFHRNLEEWIAAQPPDRNPRAPDLTGLHVTPIPAKAGDLIIWNRLLAHGNGRNTSDRPRLCQYITMSLAGSSEEARQERIACWRERKPPRWWPGDDRQREQLYGKTAELTPLGRKLLGLDLW